MANPYAVWRTRLVDAAMAIIQRPRAGTGTSTRLLGLFSSSVVDQVLLSAANFFVGFMLIRRTSDVDYGLFVLVQSGILLIVSAQNSWLSGPISVLGPKRSPEARREMIGAIEASHSRSLNRLGIIALLGPLGAYLLGFCSGLVAIVAALGVVACHAALRREYLRSVLLMYARPNSVLRADLSYIGALFVGALLAAYGPKPAVLWAVGGLVASAWVGAIASHRSLAKNPGWVAGNATQFWRQIRPLGMWAVVGSVIYWSFGQSYNYMLVSRFDLTAVANVNAARLLLMPAFVIALGIKSLLIPSAATWLAESGLKALTKRLLVFGSGIVVLDLIYIGFVWIFRDWLTVDFLHKAIGDRDLLLLLWAALALIGLVRDILMCALVALERFKPMAWLTGFSAVVSLGLMWFGMAWWGPRAVLIGQIVGEMTNLLGIVLLLQKQHRLLD
jgi:O-antigen/teichoic acid export membrane protein